MDVQSNSTNHILTMGTFGQPGDGNTWFNTLQADGMYNKPYDINMGWFTSEIFMTLYSPAYAELWTTTIGSTFEHIEVGPPGLEDWDILHHGNDFGHNMIWSDDETIYLVGSTGGQNFIRQCPYPFPGPSYCELGNPTFNAWYDGSDGMIARFDMRQVGVGVQESASPSSLRIHPSPTSTTIAISLPDNGAAYNLRILDAIGREVHNGTYARQEQVDVSFLAGGTYSVLLADPVALHTYQGRFIKL